MTKKTQKKIDDFIASCDTGDERVTQPKVELDRDTIHTLEVSGIVTGSNEFGEYIGLSSDDSMVFFGGFEAADIKRVVGDAEPPFTIEVMRTQLTSEKTGRLFNKVYARLTSAEATQTD